MAQIQRFGSSPNIADSAVRGFQQGEAISNQPLRRRSAELGVKSQEQGIQQGQAKQDRFLEESNIQSIVNGALQFQAIDKNNIPAQNDFLLKRINEIEIRKGDPRDTIEMLKMSPEDRQKTMGAILQIGQQKGLIKGAAQDPKPDTTTLIKNAEAQGLKRGTPEFNKFMREQLAKKTGTTINLPATTSPVVVSEFQKALGKSQAKRFEGIIERGRKASETIAIVDMMENIEIKTGALEPLKLSISKFINALGVKGSFLSDVAAAQSFNALSTTLLNAKMSAATGVQTDADERRFARTISNLGNSEEGNKFIANATKAISFRQTEYANFIENEIGKEEDFGKAVKKWRQFIKDNPILSAPKAFGGSIPMFFFEYRDRVKARIPNITDEQIVEAWRNDAR